MIKGLCKKCEEAGEACKGCFKKYHLLAVVVLTLVAFTIGAIVGAQASENKHDFMQSKERLHSSKQQEVLLNELNKERSESREAVDVLDAIQQVLQGETQGATTSTTTATTTQ